MGLRLGFTLPAMAVAASCALSGGPSLSESGIPSGSQSILPSPSPSASALPSLTPKPGSFAATGSLSYGRDGAAAALLKDGRVLIVGGTQFPGDVLGGDLNSAEVYDPLTGRFTPAGPMAVTRSHATATPLPDGRVLVVGGQRSGPDAEIYNPATGTFSTTGAMITHREGYSASPLPDGRVLIAGGYGKNVLASAEVFDPATGVFTPTGFMRSARQMHSASVLADGRVLVAGGQQGEVNNLPVFLDSAEIYDPATGSWASTGRLRSARANATASVLRDGRVLVAGGQGWETADGARLFATLASAELYDPGTGKWSSISPMERPRVDHTATTLSDGQVLIAGGVDETGESVGAAELFDPAVATSAFTGSMADARQGATATLLGDGRVLIAGGDNAHPTYCELYWP